MVRPVSPWLLRAFRLIARRRVRGSFTALRLAHRERFPGVSSTPLIVCLNHPSWWDPLTMMALMPRLAGVRNVYGPMEAKALQRYGIFRRLGAFPVAIDTPRGAAQFLRSAEAVLAQGDVLATTPQGKFTDARTRPPGLKAGLGALLARMEREGRPFTVVPLALEYTFWNERLPEALACVGEPVQAAGAPRTREVWTQMLEGLLAAAQDELAAMAATRDATIFETVLEGGTGAGGLYGLWHEVKMNSGTPRENDR